MSNFILALKLVHVLGASVLFGTGAGIAFFMLMAHRTGDAATIAATARIVVIADFVFTAGAVVVQPITGAALAWHLGYPLSEGWIAIALALYVAVGLCWLPVIWIQTRLRDIATATARQGSALPPQYFSLFRIWFALGWPAFFGVFAIFALMIWKPQLG